MLAKATGRTSAVPSRNALRVLRQLAFAGSTVGSFCTVAVLTYDVHRRVRVAEQIIDNKRALHSCAPNYDATSAAKRLEVMFDAAEAGEFMGLASLKNRKRNLLDGEDSANEIEAEARYTDFHAEGYNHHIPLDPLPYPQPPSGISPVSDAIDQTQNAVRQARTQTADDSTEPPTRPLSVTLVDQKIRTLLQQDREIEAAFVFLHKIPPTSKTVDAPLLETVCYLFAANAIKGNVFIARSIFHRIEKVASITVDMWATMMHLLAKEGHIDSAAVIFDKYRTVFDVPPHLMEVVLRCLIESKRLTSAKWMFFRCIKHDRDCGLSGAYLDGLWRKTRSIELLNTQFEKLLETLPQVDLLPTEKLFNPVIRANIEIGRFEEAKALVEDMPRKYGVQPGCRAYGLLAYGEALQCNWDGVMAGLREMHGKGFTQDKRDFPIVVDRVFLEFWPAHSVDTIMNFVVTCVKEFDLHPDKVLYRHILEALVEKGTKDHIEQITRMARERRWKTGVNEQEFLAVLRARLTAMQDAPIGVWRTLQAAKKGHGHASMSRRVLGTDSASWRLERDKLMPIHRDADASYQNSLTSMVGSKEASMYVPLRKRMEHFIHGGHYKWATKCFDIANNHGFYVKPLHIKLNAIAMVLQNPRNFHDVQSMIRTEWNSWRISRSDPGLFPLFFHRIFQVHGDSEAVLQKMMVFEFLNTCEASRDLTLKSHLVVAHSRALMQRHRPDLAIDLLTSFYMSRWRFTFGFDGVFLKMLVRAFSEVGNAEGVRWCMLATLSRAGEVRGFQDFIAECRAIMPLLEMRLPVSTLSSERSQQLSMLEELVQVMKSKVEGDQYWLSFHVDPDRKRRLRSSKKGIAYRTSENQDVFLAASIEDMIANFDEERELEYLLGRRHLSPEEVATTWAEEKILPMQQYPVLSEDPRYPTGSGQELPPASIRYV